MTVRGKLSLAFTALLVVLLLAGGFALNAVQRSSEHVHEYSRVREVSHLTSDLRTAIYQQLAISAKLMTPPAGHDDVQWSKYWVDDIDVQIHHAESDKERELWTQMRQSVQEFGVSIHRPREEVDLDPLVRRMETGLRLLRDHYDVAEFQSIRVVSAAAFQAQVAVGVACLFTVFAFLIYLVVIRHWLVYPIEVLQKATEKIGEGKLDYAVPLHGQNELAKLARGIETMAGRLSEHQRELLEARELSAIGELCTNVAHGLRNPLAALRATAELAHRRLKDTPKVQELVRDVLVQADRVDQRITRLFQFSRPMTLHPREWSFDELAESVRTEVQAQLEQRSLLLVIEDLCGERKLYVDKDAMVQAMAELVLNATHHSPDNSTLTIRGEFVSTAGGNGHRALRIQVIDHGAGMAPQTVEKAFHLFFTSRPEGSGMGLAMVRRTVERHNGSINLSSELGRGTTVSIDIPFVNHIA